MYPRVSQLEQEMKLLFNGNRFSFTFILLCKIVCLSYKWDEWALFVPVYYYIQNIVPERNNIKQNIGVSFNSTVGYSKEQGLKITWNV